MMETVQSLCICLQSGRILIRRIVFDVLHNMGNISRCNPSVINTTIHFLIPFLLG